MKTSLPILVLALYLATLGCDYQRKDAGNASQIRIGNTEYAQLSMLESFDFGTLRKGETNNSRTFSIENLGSAELIVGNFESSCGCAFLTDIPLMTIPPGKARDITVAVKTGTPGPHDAVVHFETNDPRRPFANTTIQWNVESIISFGQDGWYAGVFGKDAPVIATLPILSLSENITQVEEALIAEFDPHLDGIECHLRSTALTLVGEIKGSHKSDLIQSNIVIKFRDSGELALILPFRLRIQQDVEVWPMRCDVELSDEQHPFIRFLISNLATAEELSFRDQNERTLEFVTDSTGSEEWMVKLMLDSEFKSTRLTMKIGDYHALKGELILVD